MIKSLLNKQEPTNEDDNKGVDIDNHIQPNDPNFNESFLKAVSIIDNDFEEKNVKDFFSESFKECFNESDKKLTSKEILGDERILNNLFTKVVKYFQDINIVKRLPQVINHTAVVYSEFCDYYDLDCGQVYKLLHRNYKAALQSALKKYIGNRRFNELNKKEVNIKSLFDI